LSAIEGLAQRHAPDAIPRSDSAVDIVLELAGVSPSSRGAARGTLGEQRWWACPRLRVKSLRCSHSGVRIAISGTHRSGKTTLLEELSAALPKYATVDEPYHVMEEDGYEFADPPSLDDFQAQLEYSIEALNDSETNVLFDRCPADFLAYLASNVDADEFDLSDWLPRVQEAVETLDLIVFVPIEARDRIASVSSDHDPKLRRKVDERLREILLDNALGLDAEVIEVEGSVSQRVQMVLKRIQAGA
jgi:predicted ATPase